jgi:hypothetical protein
VRPIVVDCFQPFQGRQDTVVRLRFNYGRVVVARLKEALRAARNPADRQAPRLAGGWLAEHTAWFVERCYWPRVRDFMRQAGYTFDREPPPEAAGAGGRQERQRQERRAPPGSAAPNGAAPDLRDRIKSWFAGLARDYHPDRTHDDGKVMAALNDAYERLRKLLGIK